MPSREATACSASELASHDPKPFVWTADPDKIIAVNRGRQALESIH
jgi:hypothetical protein